MVNAPVIAILVTKRNPLVRLGRPQPYRWRAVNWDNRKTLAVSSEGYTNHADALAAAVQLFADHSVDARVLEASGWVPSRVGFLPANIYLIEDGVSGMQALRVKEAL